MSREQIETLLASGTIGEFRVDEFDRRIYSISDGVKTIEAIFQKRRAKGVFPDVAAYRLDRMINLEMVPVAVVREVDDTEGSLQFLPKDWINEAQRQQEGRGGSAWCALPEQWNAMSVWDLLIYNDGRNASNLLYDLDFWQVMLISHHAAFQSRKGRPPRLAEVPVEIGQGWRNAMSGLTEEALTEALGDVLDKKRIRALAARAAILSEQ